MVGLLNEPARPTTAAAVVPRGPFLVTVAGAFMVALDLSIVNVAFPSMSESFPDASTALLSWVLSAYSVVFGALLLGAGRLADRSGRLRAFQLGLLVFTVGSLLCGIAPTPWLLIAGRVVQAGGAALLMPSSLGLLLAATAATVRPQAVAMWGGISALAVATGPSLGSVLVDAGGWRWAFFVNVPVAIAASIGARRFLAESSSGGPAPDLLGVALVSVAVGAVALGITQGGDWGWSSAGVVGSFVVSAAAAVAAVRRSLTHASPAVDPSLFRSRTVTLANAATIAYGVGFFAMLLGNVLFLTSVWGYSTLAAGLAITPGPLVVASLSRTTGRLAATHGYRPVLVAGGVTFAAGLLYMVAAIGPDAEYLRVWLPSGLLIGLGVALTFPVLSAAAVAGLPPERFAAGGALNQTARQLGAVLGVAILVAILGTPASSADAVDAFHAAWIFAAGASLLSAAISAFQPRRAATLAE
jgi:EmrB/QacA subfamily drug resistance transporter